MNHPPIPIVPLDHPATPSTSPLPRTGPWWALLAFLALVGVALAMTLRQEYRTIDRSERLRLQNQARAASDSLARQFDGIDGGLLALRDSLAGPAGLSALGGQGALAQFRMLARAIPGVQGIRWIDRSGAVRVASDPSQWAQRVPTAPLLANPTVPPDASALYLAYTGAAGSRPGTLHLTRALFSSDGEFSGVVSAALEPDFAAQTLGSALHDRPMQASLLYADGTVVGMVSSDVPTDGNPAAVFDDALAQHVASGQKNSAAAVPPGAAQAELFAFSNLALAAPTDARLIVAVRRVLQPMQQAWREKAFIYGVLYLVFALACCWVLMVQRKRRTRQKRLQARQEAARQADAERLELTLTGADVGLWDWDIPSGKMVFNERWHAMLGYSAVAVPLLMPGWMELVHPDDRIRVNGRLDEHLAGRTPAYDAEYRMRHRQGHWVWILDRGKVMQRGLFGEAIRMVGAHMDITERKRAEEALRESEVRFRSLTELSSDWYWELDDQYRFVRFEGYSQLHAEPRSPDNLGLTRWDLGALNMTSADWDAHRAVLDARKTFHDFELQRIDAEGVVYWVSLSGAPIFDEQGAFRGYRGIGRSITDRKRVEDEIERLAFYDVLTGLPNRRLLIDRLTAALRASSERNEEGALLFIDLDNFKDLNDSRGHDVGDLLLERVANRLVTCVRAGDTVARLGGDEFVVMLENLGDQTADAHTAAKRVAEKVLDILNVPYQLDAYEHHSTPSLGIAMLSGHVESVDELLKRADLAMYEAKAAGRNTIRFFHPDMLQAVIARAALEADLRQSLQRNEMSLYFQAVVDETGRLRGAEALVRWRHPDRGIVAPSEFISVAEQTGLIIPLGSWVLRGACRQLVAWASADATRDLTLAVNVSARQFRHPDFVMQVIDELGHTGADPHLLKIELTESLLLSDVEDIIAKMEELKEIGVGFSLDDFGTGYSSLSYLKRLPLDQVKIDQSFVQDVLTNPNDAAIVRTILALAHSLDLAVVAEGVETQGQLDFLRAHGCSLFQGFLYGRPEPVEAMMARFAAAAAGRTAAPPPA